MPLNRRTRIGTNVISSTSGSILFADSSSQLAQDNAELFWDNTNNRIGIGTTSPVSRLDIETDSATEIGMQIMGAASQSVDLAQYVNSAGIEVMSIDENGNIGFWEGQTETISSARNIVAVAGTLTCDNVASVLSFFVSTASITYTTLPVFGIMPVFFSYQSSVSITAAGTVQGLGSIFQNVSVYTANGVAVTSSGAQHSFNDAVTINTSGGGTWANTSPYTSFRSSFVVGTGTTWGTRTAFGVSEATGAGSIATQYGLDIAALSKATTNVSIRAAGTTGSCRFVPKTKFGADSAPSVNVDITGAIAVSKATVSLTADNQTVTTADRSYISLSSNDATATNRTFILAQSTVAGQILTLEWTGTNAAELIDDSAQGTGGNHRMAGNWTPTQYDTITFISNGTDWVEVARSTN